MKNKILIIGMLHCAISYGFELAQERSLRYYQQPIQTLQIEGTANTVNIYEADDKNFPASIRYLSWSNEIKISELKETKTLIFNINQSSASPIEILVPRYVGIKKIINLAKGDVSIGALGTVDVTIQEGKVTLDVSKNCAADITVSKGIVDLRGLKDAYVDLDLCTKTLLDSNTSRKLTYSLSFLWWGSSHFKGRIGTPSFGLNIYYPLIKVWVKDGDVSLSDHH